MMLENQVENINYGYDEIMDANLPAIDKLTSATSSFKYWNPATDNSFKFNNATAVDTVGVHNKGK